MLAPAFRAAAASLLVAGGIAVGTVWYSSKNNDKDQTKSKDTMSQLPPVTASNAVEEKALQDFRVFTDWLEEFDAKGFIGEVGWPARETDNKQWNALADKWYQEAARHDVWVTAWAAGSWWGEYPLTIYGYGSGQRELSAAHSQAQVLEKYPSEDGQLRGMNLAGMEFGTEAGFSNTNPGTPGQQYFYEPDSSFAYLASKNVKLVRLPIRWERIQPTLGGALQGREIQEIRRMLNAAEKSGVKVILDLHNYGAYQTAADPLVLGATLPHEQLIDVWLKLSDAFGNHPAVIAYDIMNEPHDLPAGAYGSPAKNWEVASQATLDAIRGADDNKLIMIPGYDWSSAARWRQNHPTAWITDPENNFRYEAHQYWDATAEGFYNKTFQQELSAY